MALLHEEPGVRFDVRDPSVLSGSLHWTPLELSWALQAPAQPLEGTDLSEAPLDDSSYKRLLV